MEQCRFDAVCSRWQGNLPYVVAEDADRINRYIDGHFLKKVIARIAKGTPSVGTNLASKVSAENDVVDLHKNIPDGPPATENKPCLCTLKSSLKVSIDELGASEKLVRFSDEPLAEHARRGHIEKRADCESCSFASMRRRKHMQLCPKSFVGGILSIDLSGPHQAAKFPGEPDSVAQYALVGVYSPLRDDERQAVFESIGAQQKWIETVGGIPVETDGDEGGDYPIVIENDKAKVWPYVKILSSKKDPEVLAALQSMVAQINHGCSVSAVWGIHSDVGGGFSSVACQRWCAQQGIRRTTTVGYESSGNSKAERLIGTLKDLIRRLLAGAGLSTQYWAYSMCHACILSRYSVQSRKIPKGWPCFGERVLARHREDPHDDFKNRAFKGMYLGAISNIMLGSDDLVGYVLVSETEQILPNSAFE